MGRRSYGGRSARSAPRPSKSSSKSSPPPQSAPKAPPPASQAPTVGGGIGGMIAEGMAWGTGNAIAHRAVDAVVGPRTVQVEHVGSQATAAASSMVGSDACSLHNKAFQDCLNGSDSDISKCQYYMDMLTECRRNSGRAARAARRAAPRPAASSSPLPPYRPLHYNHHHKSSSDTPPASPAPIADRRAPPSASRAPIAVPARSSFGGAMADAIIWGTGNAVAHRAVDAVAGPRTIQVEHIGSEATAAPARAA